MNHFAKNVVALLSHASPNGFADFIIKIIVDIHVVRSSAIYPTVINRHRVIKHEVYLRFGVKLRVVRPVRYFGAC